MRQIQPESALCDEIVLDYNIAEDSIYHPSKQVTMLFGVPQTILCAQDYLLRYGVILPESAKDFLSLFRGIQSGVPHAECVVRAKTAKGELRWMQIMLTAVYDGEDTPAHAVGVVKDVTVWREAELHRHSEAIHQDIMLREALVYYEANLTCRKMTFAPEQRLNAINVQDATDDYQIILDRLINALVHPEDRAMMCLAFDVQALLARYANGEHRIELEYRRLTGEGTVMWARGSCYLAQDKHSDDVMLYFYVSNINEQKMRELSLRDRVERDALTGLYNKVSTELHMQDSIFSDLAEKRTGALVLIGLNHFRETNERRGRHFGDALLSEVGRELALFCNPEDIVGRRGGVEFLLYLRGIQSVEDAMQRVGALHDRGIRLLRESDVSLAIGLVLCPEQGEAFDVLQRKASIALFASKQCGGLARVYSDCMRNTVKLMSQDAAVGDGPLFGQSVTEQMFRTLYEAQDLDMAAQTVLEEITETFGFHYSYIFELEPDGAAQCVFQCHTQDVMPVREACPRWCKEQVEACARLVAERDMCFMRNDVSAKNTAPMALRVLYCYRSAGKLRGFVSLNRMGADDRFSEKQMNALQCVVRLLGLFLADRATNRDLSESSLLLQGIVNGMNACTYIVEPVTHSIKYINENTQDRMPGAQPGCCCYEVLRRRNKPCEDCPIDRMMRCGTKEDRSQMYLEQFGVWAKVNASLVTMPGGEMFGVFNSFDFSEQRHETAAGFHVGDFTHDTSLYDALSMSTDDYIIMCDMATKCFYFPKKMVEEFDLPAQVIVNAVPVWVRCVHKDDRADFMRDIDAMFSGRTDTHNQEYRAKNKNGEWVWLRAKGHVERDKNGTPTLFAVVLTNLGRKSKVDHLTGLLDKYEFEVSARAQLAEGLSCGALLLLGLDNFRYINNIYGWDFGDNVLKESSLRLLSTLPDKVQLYRLDGDKFGVFFPGASVAQAEAYYRSLFRVFRQHRQFGERRYYCTVSGGCACFQGQAPSFSALYQQAVCALEHAKQSGKNRLTVYDPKTMGESERVLAVMAALHDSVEHKCAGFALHFQPQMNPETGEVHSAEALLRWRDETLGMVPPSEFVPLLEQTGLIHKVGRWVLQQAAEMCRKWREVVPDFTVSVNLSFVQLQDQSFLPYLTKQMETQRITPEMLHLEITESCIVDGSRRLGDAVKRLRSLGFLIEMDDFGTGYSSLEILKNAPADVVKIDQAFVRDITRSQFDATFIQIIVQLCHSVGIRVCLEGVETPDEYQLVEPMQLDLIQGFLFGRPQSGKQFGENYIYHSRETQSKVLASGKE